MHAVGYFNKGTAVCFAQMSSPEFNKAFEDMTDFESVIERMKHRTVVSAMQNCLEKINPELINVLVHERDEYMVKELLKLEGRVVAVVGLGHLDGIEKRWNAAQGTRFIAS